MSNDFKISMNQDIIMKSFIQPAIMKLTNRTIQDAKMITKVTLHTYTRAQTIMDIGKDNSVENMKTAGSLQKKKAI